MDYTEKKESEGMLKDRVRRTERRKTKNSRRHSRKKKKMWALNRNKVPEIRQGGREGQFPFSKSLKRFKMTGGTQREKYH